MEEEEERINPYQQELFRLAKAFNEYNNPAPYVTKEGKKYKPAKVNEPDVEYLCGHLVKLFEQCQKYTKELPHESIWNAAYFLARNNLMWIEVILLVQAIHFNIELSLHDDKGQKTSPPTAKSIMEPFVWFNKHRELWFDKKRGKYFKITGMSREQSSYTTTALHYWNSEHNTDKGGRNKNTGELIEDEDIITTTTTTTTVSAADLEGGIPSNNNNNNKEKTPFHLVKKNLSQAAKERIPDQYIEQVIILREQLDKGGFDPEEIFQEINEVIASGEEEEEEEEKEKTTTCLKCLRVII